MSKVTIGSKGVVEQKGSNELKIDVPVTFPADGASTVSFPYSPTATVQAQTADATLRYGGVYTLSGNAVITMTMPFASAVPGARFIFRCASAHAHILTGSQETAGTKVFAGIAGATGGTQGSKLALPNIVGSSVVLECDGVNFLVSAMSGSCTINGL